MKKLQNETILKDAVDNFLTYSGASNEYCKGLLVGLICGIMASKKVSFNQAMKKIESHYKPGTRERKSFYPRSWLEVITMMD